MSSTSTTWTTDTNTKSGSATTYTNTVSSLQLLAAEGEDAILKLFADEADDNADQWRIVSKASNNKLNFMSYASGAWSNVLSLYGHGTAASVYAALPAASKLYLDGGTETYIQESSADVLDIYVGGANMIKLTESTLDTIAMTGNATLTHTVTTSASTPIGLLIDDNTSGVAAQDSVGLHVDFDRTVAGSGTAAHNDIGINLDVNSASLGTSTLIGMDIDVVGATSGTSTATGLTVDVGSADTNYAALFNGGNVGIGTTAPAAALTVSSSGTTSAVDGILIEEGSTDILAIHSAGSGVCAFDALYTSGDADFSFRVAGSAKMTIKESGKVGIGTASPASILHVNAPDGAPGIIAISTGHGETVAITADEEMGRIEFGASDSEPGYAVGAKIAATAAVNWDNASSNFAPTDLQFYTQDGTTNDNSLSVPRMTILSDGKVGIGTTDPANNLHVASDSEGVITAQTSVASADGGYFILRKSRNTVSSPAIAVDDDRIGTLRFSAHDGTDWASRTAEIYSEVDGSIAANDTPGRLVLATTADGAQVTSPRMTILSDGKVGIGVTDPDVELEVFQALSSDGDTTLIKASATGNSVERVAQLGVVYNTNADTDAPTGYLTLQSSDGAISFLWADDSDILRISQTSNDIGDAAGTVVGAQSSDERLKNISSDPFPYGLEDINKLTPIKYVYKDDKRSVDKLGFGAQTIQPIIPESVFDTKDCIDGYVNSMKEGKLKSIPNSEDKDTKLGMEYVQLIPVLVKAIQELSAKVTALENA